MPEEPPRIRTVPVLVGILTLVASVITILGYTGWLPPWEEVQGPLSNPWVTIPGALALVGWTGMGIAKWWRTWVRWLLVPARWLLVPVRYTAVRSLSVHRGSEGRQQTFESGKYKTKWVRRGKVTRLRVTGEAVIHAIEIPYTERVEFVRAPSVPQVGGSWWYQCHLTKPDGSEWMQYTTAVVEPNRNPERGNRIEDRSILCIVDRDTDTAPA